MSLTTTRARPIDSLAAFAGLFALMDTVIGMIVSLALDLSRTDERAMAITLVLGFPAYLLDRWLGSRIAISLLVLVLFRWLVLCFVGGKLVLVNPVAWPVGILLFSALVLLQISKLRRPSKA